MESMKIWVSTKVAPIEQSRSQWYWLRQLYNDRKMRAVILRGHTKARALLHSQGSKQLLDAPELCCMAPHISLPVGRQGACQEASLMHLTCRVPTVSGRQQMFALCTPMLPVFLPVTKSCLHSLQGGRKHQADPNGAPNTSNYKRCNTALVGRPGCVSADC
eukprot:1152275-Pelagomonas_calceolata.AAC.9